MKGILPRGRKPWLGAAAIALACLLGGALLFPKASPTRGGTAGASAGTARVIRTTLIDSRTASGTLGFGNPVDVQFISRARTGIVTWIAGEGTVVSRGEPLFAIDGQPVVLFYGELPLFRSLRFHGSTFAAFDWLELDNARDEERRAALALEAQRARLAEATTRLEEVRMHLEDSTRDPPATPQFVRLAQSVAAARDRLHRLRQLAESRYASPAEVQQAEYDLAAAQAERDAARRDQVQMLAAAQTALAEAKLAVHQAERVLRDARDARDALLASAKDNTDVRILQDNLAVLGHDGPAQAAIRGWQQQVGRSATGLVEPGHVVVATGPVRVAAHLASVGDVLYSRTEGQNGLGLGNQSSQVLRYTSTERIVTVPLELADHDYARVDETVTVTLPTNDTVSGVISKVGTQFDQKDTADAQIRIPAQDALGNLESAVVDVEFVTGRREDVLAVPVTALLALPGGGFGVEVIAGDATRVVPVETGLFARGQVEVSGADITEGLIVRIPQ